MITANKTRASGRQWSGVIPALLVVSTLGILLATGANSLPRLAAEQALACKTCHLSPTGGGMRTEFGNQAIALNELCLPQTKQYFLDKAKPPRVAPALQVGFDTRYLALDDGSLFRMQTDAFLDFTPLTDMHYFLRVGENGISENYGLFYFDDQRYYVRAGRFYPAFGLRIADHTAFVRERTGHPSSLYLDGIAVGAEYGGYSLTAETFAQGSQNVYGLHLMCNRYVGRVSLLAGGSLRSAEKISGHDGQFPQAVAMFGGLAWDRFTVMGELDLVGRGRDSLAAYAGLTTRLEYGLYLVSEYNFFDGDRDRVSGVDEFVRLSIELFPIPFVEIRPSYTYYTRGYLEKSDDFFLQLHVGY